MVPSCFLLQQLRQERLGRNHDRAARLGEAICVHVVRIDDDMEGEGYAKLFLVVPEACADGLAAIFDFREEPRFAVAGHQEIDLVFLFVAQVAELELAEARLARGLRTRRF